MLTKLGTAETPKRMSIQKHVSKEGAEEFPDFWGNACLMKNYVQLFALGFKGEDTYIV